MHDIRRLTVRGGAAKTIAQVATFAVRLAAMMILSRLLDPTDFGLVAMVTVVTGFFNLFRECGLSLATVQWDRVTTSQLSTSFWLNLATGGVLAVLLIMAAPFLAAFYREPRLLQIAIVLALGFVFNAIGIQHSALLQRAMRFGTIAVIDTGCQLVTSTIGIILALLGWKYWALVIMGVTAPLAVSLCVWAATGWVPERPSQLRAIFPMLRFGGTITLASVVVYATYNVEKVLMARFWGADALGVYTRAYQLIALPTDNLDSAFAIVAITAFSRVRHDPGLLKAYFLKMYALFVGLIAPVTAACLLFADDIVLVALGPKWGEAVTVLRLLGPTALALGLLYPTAWFLFANGLAARRLKIALAFGPLLITAFALGVPYGPAGVALAYSIAMSVWVIPQLAWVSRGTVISLMEIGNTLRLPLLSCGVAAAITFLAQQVVSAFPLAPVTRLTVNLLVLLGTYLVIVSARSEWRSLARGVWRDLSTPAGSSA